VSSSPAFGQADLTNCERELIHLAGSIQPHGLLLVVREPSLRIVQASRSAETLLQRPLDALLQAALGEIGGDLESAVRTLIAASDLQEPQPLRCAVPAADGATLAFEGAAHRIDADTVVVELEPLAPAGVAGAVPPWDGSRLLEQLGGAVQRFSEATSIGVLADQVVRCVRELAGYDRVMVYQFDPDGHGKIIAEARDPRLESLLGHHYPATDIPQRARELYVRNRVRVLVDVNYEPSPLLPRLLPGAGGQGPGQGESELDMSMSFLRSMSPLHLQYLRNMGVTATLVVSLVREGRLWGLIACHHDTPRQVGYALRAATELLAEAIATRIAAIENYAHAQVAIQVRRLEQRLIEATATEGDWRLALVRDPRMLQQPLDATGAALFHDGELLTCGEVPSTPELRALMQWIDGQAGQGPFASSAVGRDNPALASLTPTASGVLAVKLSAQRPDYLVWFRKEQLQSVTWAGDPTKPMIDNDPLKLSPRRSFAAWSEIVRGSAVPWTASELAMAAAFGDALVDIIVQVSAVRLLIAEHQLAQVRAVVADSKEAVAVADGDGRMFYANAAFCHLAGRLPEHCGSLETMLALFTEPAAARQIIGHVRAEQRTWRGELTLARPDGTRLPVAVRGEPVPARDGSLLGVIFLFNDLSENKRAAAARQRLESALSRAGRGSMASADSHALVGAIIANASLAAMDIADGGAMPTVAPLLDEVEAATARATLLYGRIRAFAPPRR
jgi:two-component system, chemotaxis family, sensor kinase Cph1